MKSKAQIIWNALNAWYTGLTAADLAAAIDARGPSFVVDTACSSALAALFGFVLMRQVLVRRWGPPAHTGAKEEAQ